MLTTFGFGDSYAYRTMSFGAAVGALAIVAKLTAQRQRSWLRRDLQRGDLSF
jgi:hypothetical protein